MTKIFKRITAVFENGPDYTGFFSRYTCSNDIFEAFKWLGNETKEHFITLHLDAKNKVICQDAVAIGSLSAAIVHPREVFKTALLSSAAAMIFIHNHPSGDPQPSREDIELTSRLKDCGELFGIRILDHIIIADNSFLSFIDRGLL